MLTKRLHSLLLLSMILSSGLIGLPSTIFGASIVLRTGGTGPRPSSDSLESIYDCTASYLVYINCPDWLSHVPIDGDYKKTIVVFDSGLTANQWASIQIGGHQNLYGDIISYWTLDADTGEIVAYGGEGPETADYLSSIGDKLSPEGVTHGFWVISSLLTIARGAQIIVVDIATDPNSDPAGLQITDPTLWTWLSSNVSKFNIGVFTTSLQWPYLTQSMFDNINSLYSQQVFMVTAAGNTGRDESTSLPNNLEQFFPVSSIDHENRGKWMSIGGINFYDEDYYSDVGHLSGDTAYGHTYCPNTDTILCSSWGSSIRPVRFAMPGHFITLMSEYMQGRPYPVLIKGTSIAAPLLAGAALVAIYAYSKGYFETNGVYQTPSRTKLVELLESAGSQASNPDQYLGVGYVDLGSLYDLAYSAGLDCLCEGGGGGSNGGGGGFWR